MTNETFISYSRKDSQFLEILHNRLKEENIDPWVDKHDIPSAALWKQEIFVAIQFCHNFVYVLSPDSLTSQYCNDELDHALSMNKRLIPIVCRPFDHSDVREAVSELNYIFFNEDFEQGFKNLLNLLDSPIGATYGDRLDSQITIYEGNHRRTFSLYRNQYLIGRKPRAPFSKAGIFLLEDKRTSRHHATLVRNKRWFIYDGEIEFNTRGKPIHCIPSSNGVFVGSISPRNRIKPLQVRPLVHGDKVWLSPTTYFVYEELYPNVEEATEGIDKDTYTGE